VRLALFHARYNHAVRCRLLNLLTAVSLLLCVAVCVLWVRSYVVNECVRWQEGLFHSSAAGRLTAAALGSGNGRFAIAIATAHGDHPGNVGMVFTSRLSGLPAGVTWMWDTDYEMQPAGEGATVWEHLGFRFDWEPASYSSNGYYRVGFPLWLPALTFGVMPGRWLYRRRQSRAPGLCPSCGYDLRATPGRCPECGFAVTDSSRT
jgi:hypothetical protein